MLVLIFAFFAIVSKTAKFNISINLIIYEEILISCIDLAKFNTSKMNGTPKPQTNVPVKICHFKVQLS